MDLGNDFLKWMGETTSWMKSLQKTSDKIESELKEYRKVLFGNGEEGMIHKICTLERFNEDREKAPRKINEVLSIVASGSIILGVLFGAIVTLIKIKIIK